MTYFADRVIGFLAGLQFNGKLPSGISVMNPFAGDERIMDVVVRFYREFYSDNNHRCMIMGIKSRKVRRRHYRYPIHGYDTA